MPELSEISESLIVGNQKKVKELTEAAIAGGVKPEVILTQALIPGMAEVGRRMKENIFYVPEVLIAARAMYAGLKVLRPLLAESDLQPVGRVAAGTVKGDLHDIGKNLVCMMLEGAGFEINDLGVDVSPDKFVEAVKTKKANIVVMSALLTTTMPSMKTTIEALKGAGVRGRVKVMVGGAPLTQKYADEIGADGYAPDASSAVDKAKELVGAR